MNSRRSSRRADWSAAPDLRRGPPGPRERSEIVLVVRLLQTGTVPSSLVPWPALGRSAPRGGAVKRPYGFVLVDFGQKAHNVQ